MTIVAKNSLTVSEEVANGTIDSNKSADTN